MKQKIHVVLISVVALSLLVVSFIFAIDFKKESANYFYDSGYILSNNYESGSDNVNKLYFEAKTSYKNNKDNEYTFTNSEGEKVEVNEESFVHYSNGSIMSLKKGVAIDLNDIDSKLISYYNIFEGSILTKKNEIYEIENLNESIGFSKLMFKISNNKYLLGAPKIVISFSDNQTVELEKYAEIEYVSENVIRIYNDSVNYQTIASNLYVIIDNIKIDLEYKTISKNNIEYLTMADMIINSNDNIEILPKPEKEEVPKEETSNNNSGGNTQGNNQGTQNNGSSNGGGNVDSGVQEGIDNLIDILPDDNEQIDTENEFIQPKFKVESMDVTTLGFENLSLTFEDESSVLYGNRTVEILENSTGKVVQKFDDWDEGSQNYVINSYFSLKPNNAYTLNVVGQYKVDETIYDRTFISKIFRTLDVGLEIVEDYISSDSLSFAVYKNSYSEVSGFTYNIVDKDGNIMVEDTKVEYSDSDVLIITESDIFNPNTTYTLYIKDIKYGNDVFSTVSYQELQLTHKAKTLKQNPFKEKEIALKSSVDNRKNTVTFNVEGIKDLNGGIKDYTYNVYNTLGELKYTITKNDSNGLTLDFEELADEDVVYFNVQVNFDDNEKTIVFISQNSVPVSLTGASYPKVVDFVSSENNKDCEKLIGEIVLDDDSDFIAMNDISYYKIDVKENINLSLGGTQQYVGTVEIEHSKKDDQFTLPVYFDGLKPNTEYILYVYLMHNGKYIYLGYDIGITQKPDDVYLNFIKPEEENENSYMFDFQISKNVEKPASTIGTMKSLGLELYGCSKSNNQCKKLGYTTTIPKNQGSTDLEDMLINNTTININSNDFSFYIDDYNVSYNYKVVATGYAANYEIPIKINDTDSNEFEIEFNNIQPELTVKATEVIKSDCKQGTVCDEIFKSENNLLNDDTVVGFNFETKTTVNPMGKNVEKMYYEIVESNGYQCSDIDYSKPIVNSILELDSTEKIAFVPLGNSENDISLKRGKRYCMKYYGEYGGNDGEMQKTKSKYLSFVALKQNVEISGYIKKYTGASLSFGLIIDDPDKSLINNSISLSNDKIEPLFPTITESQEQNDSYSVYTFDSLVDKYYSLIMKENVGNGEKSYKIYDVQLDDIISYDNLNIKVDTDVPGEVTLKIPYINCEDDVCTENSNLLVDRIAGLNIKYNDGKDKLAYFDLTRGSNELYVKLNLSDIIAKNYGVINDNKLSFDKISIYYDSGKIVDYLDNNKLVLIKTKDGKYYNTNQEFSDININSIYNTTDLDTKVGFSPLSFSANVENSSIGMLLGVAGDVGKLINFNETTTVGTKLYDIDGNLATDFEINVPVSTSEIKTKYTSTGANISFGTTNKAIKEGTQLQIVLNSENYTEEAIIEYESSGWTSYSNGTKIKNINQDNGIINVEFDDIDDKQYNYSINYKIVGTMDDFVVTYNDGKQITNNNIIINSLKELVITSKSAKFEKQYWDWNNDYTDISSVKKILNSFEVDTSKYILNENEKIVYSLIAKDTSNQTTILLEDVDLAEEDAEKHVSLNKSTINLFSDKLSPGSYEIIVKPVLRYKDNSSEDIKLSDFSLNGLNYVVITETAPTFSSINSQDPTFSIEMSDEDSMLMVCPDTIMNNSLTEVIGKSPMNYVDDYSKTYFSKLNNKSKVVYLELFSITGGNNLVYRGYSPIPFAYKTAYLDLTTYFTQYNLPTGNYKIKFKYCVSNSDELQETEINKNFYIYNTSKLNAKIITMPDSYVLMLENPDLTIKDSINRIVYQYTAVDGTTFEKTLSNLDDEININNNIEYTTSVNASGTTNYFLGLSTGGVLTSNIRSLEIRFYSGATDDTLITMYSK